MKVAFKFNLILPKSILRANYNNCQLKNSIQCPHHVSFKAEY